MIVYRSTLLARSETFIREQAKAMKRWHPILAGAPTGDGLDLSGLDVCPLPKRDRRTVQLLKRIALPFSSHAKEMARLLRPINANLIHAHFGTDAVDVSHVALALNLPLLVTLHGYDINIHREWWESGYGGRRWRDYPARLLELANHPLVTFLAVSSAIQARAVEFGIAKEKIRTHFTGIDTAKFTPATSRSDSEKAVLFVGRLVEKKGVEYLLQACANVFKDVPDAKLVIAGEGPCHAHLRETCLALGVRAEFLGAVNPEQVRDLMRGARVLCLPSVTASNGDAEGFGMVLLEAQACGTPVITSARGGAIDGLIDGQTGFAFPEKDINTLSKHLKAVLVDDALHQKLSMAAVSFARNKFDLSRCTAKLESIYDRITNPDDPTHESVLE